MRRGYKNSHIDLTAKFVRKIFDYDPKTGILRWKVMLSKRAVAGKIAGSPQLKGRIKIGILNHDYMAHRIIWLYQTGQWPIHEIDHINGNQSDNRWKNLREATSNQNHYNRGLQTNNTSGYKGVCYGYPKKKKPWVAYIKYQGQRQHLGLFTTAKEAYEARRKAARKLHGKFAIL